MENKTTNAINNFINDDIDSGDSVDNKKFIKSDFTLIERVDRILVTNDGKQLLREQY